MQDPETRHALVLALAHEIGNQLAGIRLEAHLLDETLGAAGLARASLAIDALAGQAAPLLALLRPLLAPEAPRAPAPSCASVLESVRRQLEQEGTGGHPIELEVAAGADAGAGAIEGLHALLLALIGSPKELGSGGEPIRLGFEREAGGVVVVCELPRAVLIDVVGASGAGAAVGRSGAADVPSPPPAQALRGRSLACAIARVLAVAAGGRLEVRSESGRARIELHLPR